MFSLAGLSMLSLLTASTLAEVRSYNFTIHEGKAAPDGFSRPVYLINGQHPAPLIEANEDDTLEVFVKNELPVETTIHWHGTSHLLLVRCSMLIGALLQASFNVEHRTWTYPIAPGGNFTYRFDLSNEYGFYWYHSHFRAYYNDAIRGPLNIRPKRSRSRPFESLASSDAEAEALLRAERDAFPVLLTDWYHEVSDTVLQEYNRTGVFPHCVDSLLANGLGRVQCLPQAVLDCGPSLCLGSDDSSSMSMESSGTTLTSMASSDTVPMSMAPDKTMLMFMQPSATAELSRSSSAASSMDMSLGPRGCIQPTMFRPGFNASDLPPETCTETMAPLLTIAANFSSGWLALNLVNAGSTTKLTVSLDSHTMYVYAADGLFVKVQEVEVLPMSLGERYSVMIKLDQTPGDYTLRFASIPVGDMQQVIEDLAVVRYTRGVNESFMSAMESSPPRPKNNQTMSMLGDETSNVHMLVNGSAKPTASTLRPQNLGPFDLIAPPRHNNVATRVLNINQTGIVSWVVDRYSYSEPKVPVIYGNISDGWNASTTMFMPFNTTIDLIMRVAPDSMDTMGHPMHLHGHKFWILGSGQGEFPYSSVQDVPDSLVNLDDPPYRDTVELPASGWAVIRQRFAWAYQNLKANVQFSSTCSMQIIISEDFYTALLKIGFNVLTAASEAVYLNEGSRIKVPGMTWLEQNRVDELAADIEKRKAPAVPSELLDEGIARGVRFVDQQNAAISMSP
ncbi:hypothetical protein B0A48_18489 [Cryoendolithus antarcticus]|uniref:Plastocyanin-like domain-containing protein n=1 Tax=Cryoendolithus antarcticus TaxID=1507870 RepID=A0A1V8S8I0_9PEZI|nr:hypothetical protein B0A48_18489 [Cryoendolithus antarcticus]